ncbi:tonB-system energizer ExbB [Ancylobacter sp. VNQ12]|uniref:tonB-system energizer ExbB n=1 Tax=Ancylobacter sp. VNQ12 TaxID=3400920 RepID=UPI003C02B011
MLTLRRIAPPRPRLNALMALLVAGGSVLPACGPALAQQPATPQAPIAAPATPAPVQQAPSAAPADDALVPPSGASLAPSSPASSAPAGDVAAPATGTAAAPEGSVDPTQIHAEGEDTGVAAQLPHDLSPWGMFMAADWVVKGVMIGLAFASVVTWTVWLAKSLELLVAKGRLKRALKGYLASASLDEARRVGTAGPAGAMLKATDLELQRSGDLPAEGIKERVSISLGRIEVAAGRAITRGTGLLATIGATAPFVGLFGTVWGIMNSFIGISKAQTTNLAVVAPGIAEALLATAIGLVAAIPAVVIYNHFTRLVSGYRVLMGDASAEVLRLLSRDLDRRDMAAKRGVQLGHGAAAAARLRAAAE